MILVVCPNPAIDRTLLIDAVDVGSVNRVRLVSAKAGGKGFNVARVLTALGREVTVVTVAGGSTGQDVVTLAEREGIAVDVEQTAEPTRVCTIVTDGKGADTLFNEVGPTLDGPAWAGFCQRVRRLARSADRAVVSGSLPPVRHDDPMGALIEALGTARWWIDSSGAALGQAVRAQPEGIKVNRTESAGLRRPAGATLVVTDGRDAVTVESDDGRWVAEPPRVEATSAAGSGDAFLAGWLACLADGVPAALRLGVAAGSDNATRLGGGLVDGRRVAELARSVVARRG